MNFQVRGMDDELLDAHYELRGSQIIFHARGGSTGKGSTNSEYGPGLRALLRRLSDAGLTLEGAWVDSSMVRHLASNARRFYGPEETHEPEALFTILSSRMKQVGRPDGAKAGGNATRRIRIKVDGVSEDDLEEVLDGEPSSRDLRHLNRLTSDQLSTVRADHIYSAVQELVTDPARHEGHRSTTYILIDEAGNRLPPKAVFGLAASKALGIDVAHSDFVGGEGTPCFRILRQYGYKVVPIAEARSKLPQQPSQPPIPLTEEDASWAEGRLRRVQHLKRERSTVAAKAKRDQFRAEHGRLFCEECGFDPVKTFGGEHGEACIEAHHVVPLSQSDGERDLKLSDLVLLCANCHRVAHRLMRDHDN